MIFKIKRILVLKILNLRFEMNFQYQKRFTFGTKVILVLKTVTFQIPNNRSVPKRDIFMIRNEILALKRVNLVSETDIRLKLV